MTRALTRWEPFAELGELRARLDRMFGMADDRMPAIDIMRDDGNLVVRADAPGMKPDEVKIEIEDGILTLSGEHEESKNEKEGDYVRRERSYGAFSRSLALPAGVDPGQVKAETKDGVVEVTIPVPEEGSKEKVAITPTAA
jgi:HSP20 family protein